ncbi:MAG TPA: hypothetical protein PKI61_02820 [bacterium]|nr:hypothetical protein [bacterium]HPT29843.1 hypothetical protein [bacterium]
MAEQIDNFSAEQEAAQRIEAERNQARLLAEQQAQAAALAEQRMATLKGKGDSGGATQALSKGITLLLKLALKAETTILFALGVAWINIHLLMSKFMPKLFVPLGSEDMGKKSNMPASMQKMQQKIMALKDNVIHFAETGCCCMIIIIVLLIVSVIVAAFDPSTNGVFGIFEF